MCGILGFLCTEGILDVLSLETLIIEARERGKDGFGLVIYRPNTNEKVFEYKSLLDYAKTREDFLRELSRVNMQLGDIVLGICRNAPETELMSTQLSVIQPLEVDNFLYVHNGSVTDKYVNEYKDQMETGLDSEVIGLAYSRYGRNMKIALESISGGWSLIGLDKLKRQLIVATSFLPLAQGYIKGYGYVIHSSITGIRKLLKRLGYPTQYTRIWENFYCDELPPYTIFAIDVDSGLVVTNEYNFNFLVPQSNKSSNKTICLVSHSGGIDSTTTILALKEYAKRYSIRNIGIRSVYIDYGHKSAEAEKLAVKQICDKLGVELQMIEHPLKVNSMLTSDNIDITTATDELKSTVAWVPARNLVFLTYLTQVAEDLLLKGEAKQVVILGGFPNISEESVYPDNSECAINAFNQVLKFFTVRSNDIKITNIMSGLTKKEELILMKHWGYEELFGYTISCDHAIVKGGKVYQCAKNGRPACGSGLLSKWAATLAGIQDNRNYYEVDWDIEPIKAKWEEQEVKVELPKPEVLENSVFKRIDQFLA